MSDLDDFTGPDPCGCGHRMSAHYGPGGSCTGTLRDVLDYDALPLPVFADDDPFAWPSNWPPSADCPRTDRPCTCSGWSEPEPDIPEEYL